MTQRIRSGSSLATVVSQRVGKNETAVARVANGREQRWRIFLFGVAALVVVGLFINLTSQSKQTNSSFVDDNQSPTIPGPGSPLKEKRGNNIILEASISPSQVARVYQDTQHSHTSPLSSQFQPHQTSKDTHLQPYIDCKLTEKVKIGQTPQNQWQLTTFQSDGTPKSVGGDEYYVTFTRYYDVNRTIEEDPVYNHRIQHPTLVAIVTDLKNGTFHLDFYRPPSVTKEWETSMLPVQQQQDGYLTIYLTYSCGMGLVTQKSDWHSRGSLDWVHVQQYIPTPPSWKPFVPPTTTTKIRLSNYAYVAAFGDSVLGLFVGQYLDNLKFRQYPIPEGFPPSQKVHFKGNIRTPFLHNTDELKKTFQKWHGKQLLPQSNQQQQQHSAAILMGSGTWDLGSFTWSGGDESFALEPTVQAYQAFWTWLLDTYPGVDIYWKSLSAVHPHNLRELRTIKPVNMERVKMGTMYVSSARAKALDDALREMIHNQFNDRIGILDVYFATSLTAEWLFPDDSHHYRWELNRHMLVEWFY